MKTYQKTQRSPKYVRRLQNEVHPCESLQLASKMATILDFEKCSRMNSIHQADFVYVMSEAAGSSEKKLYEPSEGSALATWLVKGGVNWTGKNP